MRLLQEFLLLLVFFSITKKIIFILYIYNIFVKYYIYYLI